MSGCSCLTGHVPAVPPPCTLAKGVWRGCQWKQQSCTHCRVRIRSTLVAGAAAPTERTTRFAAAKPKLSPARACRGRLSRRQPRLRRPGAGGRAARRPRGPAAAPRQPGRRRPPPPAPGASASGGSGEMSGPGCAAAAAGGSCRQLSSCKSVAFSCPTSCACGPRTRRPQQGVGPLSPLNNAELCGGAAHCSDGSRAQPGRGGPRAPHPPPPHPPGRAAPAQAAQAPMQARRLRATHRATEHAGAPGGGCQARRAAMQPINSACAAAQAGPARRMQ